MTINKRRLLIAGAACALPVSYAQIQSTETDLPLPASKLNLSPLPLLNGDFFQPQSLNQQWLVLYYWASWCPFCAQQTPFMQKLHEQVNNKGMTVLGVSIDKQLHNAKIHFQKYSYTFASAWLNPLLKSVNYKPKTIPTTLIYNPQQILVQAEKGQMFAEDIENL